MAEKPKTPATDSQDAAILAGIAPFLESLMATSSGGPTDTSTTTSTSSVTKLTTATAKALMTQAAQEAGYTGKFSNADVQAFIKDFNAKQNAQIEKVVQISRDRITPGATPEAQKKIMQEVARQEYPSFFKPAEFAKDFIWSKIDFKNEGSLGAKSLASLASVRAVVDAFQLLGVSDADAKIAAKQIAMGKKTLEEYTVELQQIAKKEYPNLADRFAKDPTLTTYDIASPIINMLAKTWQVDAKTIGLNNPYVTQWLRPGGADGKAEQPSYHDMLMKAKNDPKYDATTEAIENARGAATSLSSMLGFGV
jgi:hypothetical protein